MNPSQEPRPAFTQQPETPSLLDRVVSENRLAQRDDLILKKAEFDYKQRLAKMFANAQCFADVDKAENGSFFPEDVSIARAMIKIELGESMGFTPAESMSGIDIIKGRPAIGAHLRAARMKKAGYSWTQMNCTDKGCWMPLEFNGQPMMHQKVDDKGTAVLENGKPVMVQVIVSYTEADAQRAGNVSKDNYKKDPSAMYFARCVTRAQRRYGPEVLGAEILDTYEAREIASPDMETATTSKTEDLALKLTAKREASSTNGAPIPAVAPIPIIVPDPDSWGARCRKSFVTQLGEPEYLAVLTAVTGSESDASVTVENHKDVWIKMQAAVTHSKAVVAGLVKPGTTKDLF